MGRRYTAGIFYQFIFFAALDLQAPKIVDPAFFADPQIVDGFSIGRPRTRASNIWHAIGRKLDFGTRIERTED